MKNQTMQQGDLILRRLNQMPAGEWRVIMRKRLVLAHGESGHSHVIEDDEAELIQVGERMLMRLENPSYVGPVKNCTLRKEDETSFVVESPLGIVAFPKSIASFSKGTVKVGKFGLLDHEEHFKQAAAPGIWEVGRVKEHDYFSQMTRQVMD